MGALRTILKCSYGSKVASIGTKHNLEFIRQRNKNRVGNKAYKVLNGDLKMKSSPLRSLYYVYVLNDKTYSFKVGAVI